MTFRVIRVHTVAIIYTQGSNMSETGIRVRIDPELRDKFILACRNNDLTASQVIRSYIREYVKSNLQQESKDNDK